MASSARILQWILTGEPVWGPGDFLVHFAGVYDLGQMKTYAERCARGEVVRIPMEPGEIAACEQSRDHSLSLMAAA